MGGRLIRFFSEKTTSRMNPSVCAPPVRGTGPSWWERRSALTALCLIGLIPLLWPALPPLADLPGHMGRWHIAMALDHSPLLARFYSIHWSMIGNLGMDALVPALASVLPFELATKLAVLLIPAITLLGLLWVAREVHGRVPPTALLALPIVYAWPFQFGFVNFALAQGLAFCAFGLWLRLGRLQRLGQRAALFAPIALLLWLTHSFGWVIFGLMAVGSEAARLRAAGRTWPATLWASALQALPLALPLVAIALTPHGNAPTTGDWFNWEAKGTWLVSLLRDRWIVFDLLSLLPLLLVSALAARSAKLGFSASLGWPALLCGIAFLLLPREALGGSYVDMRIVPAMAMLGLLAITPPQGSPRFAQRLAALCLAFFLIRTAATTASFALRADEQQTELGALAYIPRGASVLALVARPCKRPWSDLRDDHLAGIAIVRRDVFTNVEWDLDGQQVLRVHNPAAGPYLADPSQYVYPARCPERGQTLTAKLAGFPRTGFDYVWTLGSAPLARVPSDLHLIWSDGPAALYRVQK